MATKNTSRSNANKQHQAGQQVSRLGEKRLSAEGAPSLIDDKARREIFALAFCVLAIVLFLAAVLNPSGLVTNLVSQGLHVALGFGAFVLPFFMLLVSGSFLYPFERPYASERIALGLFVLLVSILSLAALFTPSAEENLSNLFLYGNLVLRGGFLGAGPAWVALKLFGLPISCIIFLGLIVISFILIGFSITSLIECIRTLITKQDLGDSAAQDPLPEPAILKTKQQKPANLVRSIGTKPRVQNPKQEDISSQKTTALTSTSFDAPAKAENQVITRKLGAKSSQATSSAPTKAISPAATPLAGEDFALPSSDILKQSSQSGGKKETEESLRETAGRLQNTLEDFGIFAQVVGWVAGPTVTLFKVDLPSGVRVSRVTALSDDIALALAAPGVRIFAPIPGTNYVGIEVPNKVRESVLLGDILPDAQGGPLQIAVGKDVEGRSIISDLARMPHILIGGTTGSGKSVSINAMIMSILMRATPSEVRFIMIDPKRVEFSPYNGIPHLYVPVVTEAREAASALSWGVAEMERRLKVFSKVGAKNISQYNEKVEEGLMQGDEPAKELPYIVIIIDELADLMMNVGKEVEFSISRIAQLARAAGIHLIVATQRPSTNVVTGLIKANITNRIAFNVASGIDSRVVLDTPGAENLIGLGDLLFSKPEFAKPVRIQGCFVSEAEIEAVVDFLKSQGEPDYHSEILSTNVMSLGNTDPAGGGGAVEADDPLIWEAADIVVNTGLGSTSNLQRRLKVGYSRAGRIMDMLEEKGVVGPPNGSKPREVLVDILELETLKAFEQQDQDG